MRAAPSHTLLSRREFVRAGLAGVGVLATRISPLNADELQQPADDFIDAHAHVWPPETTQYPLAPGYSKEKLPTASFTPEQLLAHARPCGVRRSVLIQYSFYGTDNSYLLDSLRRFPGVFSAVAVIDAANRPRETMLVLAAQGVRGFRIRPGDATPDRWLDDSDSAAMWKCGAESGLAMCPLIDPRYLVAIDRMCRRFPDTPVVIDHFARIGADGQIRATDLANLAALSAHKNVHVKLSAFYALGRKQSPYLDLAPMIRRLLDGYGSERLLWGTDSPFQTLGGHRYQDSLNLLRTQLDFLSPTDRQWLLRKTAERLFFA